MGIDSLQWIIDRGDVGGVGTGISKNFMDISAFREVDNFQRTDKFLESTIIYSNLVDRHNARMKHFKMQKDATKIHKNFSASSFFLKNQTTLDSNLVETTVDSRLELLPSDYSSA